MGLLRVLLCLCVMAGATLSLEAGETTVEQYKVLELQFTAASSPANPFDTYLLKVEVTAPNGTKTTLDGFFDGNGSGGAAGKVWKARICPDQPGAWTWRTVPGDAADANLAGLTGTFNCAAGTDRGGVIRQGQLFKFQNGGYVYLQGNFLDFTNGLRSTHTYMSETTTDAQRAAILARQQDFHTANKVNVYFANKGDYSSQSVTPWVGSASTNDKTQMDLERWKLYDGYIRDFKEHALLAQMWFFADDSSFGSLSTADRNRLLRYGMARTSAFNHTLYVISLEWGEAFTATEVTAMGNFLQAHNPWGRVVSVHNHTDWAFSGQSWATFIATQAGNSAGPGSVNTLARDMRSNENIPHIDEEYGILNTDSNTGLRNNLWANFCGGAAGGGTGSDLKAFQRFVAQSRVPIQRMGESNSLIQGGGSTRFCLAEPGHHYVAYSTTGAFTLNVTGSGLTGYWFDPRNPSANLSAGFAVTAGNQSFMPPSSTASDWVLWITDGSNLGSGTTHPSTGATVVTVVVTNTNLAPSCALTAPSGGATFTVGQTVTMTATASDSDGTVSRVDFFDGATLLGSDSTAPYAFAWNTTGASTGTHALHAEAVDNLGAVGTSSTVNITLTNGGNQAPVIGSFTVSPDPQVKGSAVTYTLTASDADDATLTYTIDVDNNGIPEKSGTLASGASVSYNHTFTTAGTRTAKATVTDAASQAATKTTTVSIAEPLTAANTGANPSSGTAPLTVIFSGSQTGGIPTFTYTWDFGDGQSDPGPGNDVTHVYTVAGTYTAQVTVTDGTGTSVLGQTTITVTGATPLTAAASATPTAGTAPLTVSFTGSASGGSSGGSGAFLEQGGSVTVEAENYTAANTRTDPNGTGWVKGTATAGYVGSGYGTTVAPAGGSTNATWANAAELSYDIQFATAGTYKVWLRRACADATADSVYLGLDGAQIGATVDNNGAQAWGWYGYSVTTAVTAGLHTLNLRRREAGYEIDRIYITKNGDTPAGNGPAESLRQGGAGYTFSWNFGDGSALSTLQNPSHTYTAAGNCTAVLTVSDGVTSDTDSVAIAVSAPANQAPVIDSGITANPNPVVNQNTANLFVTAHDPDNGPQPLNFTWSKVSGPGTVSFAPNGTTGAATTTATFAASGTYQIQVTVSDSVASVSDSLSIAVTLSASNLTATASATPTSGTAPLTVNFSGSATGGNPGGGAGGAYLEQGGAVTVEAEHFAAADTRSDPNGSGWVTATANAGFVGSGYTTTNVPGSSTNGSWDNAAELAYDLQFATAGTYKIWLRRFCADATADSVYLGLDGTQIGAVVDNNGAQAWGWYGHTVTINVAAGAHTLNVRRREAGYQIDRIYVTKNGDTPTGNGPAESAQSGSGGYTYSWTFGDGSAGSTQQNPTHSYTAAGNYTAVLTVSDGANSDTDAVTIAVSAAGTAPSITTQPANATVSEGQTATFSVTATGTAPLSYQWQKNGGNIAGATGAAYSTPATTLADSGATYRVLVTNGFGSTTSTNAILTVNPAGTAFTLTINSVASGQAYQVATLAAGTTCFIDRSYTFITPVSGAYDGQRLIRTANNDKTAQQATFLTFTVNQAVTVYVAYDVRASSLPTWLAGWTPTGDSIHTSDVIRNVYAKTYAAGTIVLGGNHQGGNTGAASMYNVVVVPTGGGSGSARAAAIAASSATGGNQTGIDSDGDGLLDTFEIRHGLNPYAIDSDGDGTVDEDEYAASGGATYWALQRSGEGVKRGTAGCALHAGAGRTDLAAWFGLAWLLLLPVLARRRAGVARR